MTFPKVFGSSAEYKDKLGSGGFTNDNSSNMTLVQLFKCRIKFGEIRLILIFMISILIMLWTMNSYYELKSFVSSSLQGIIGAKNENVNFLRLNDDLSNEDLKKLFGEDFYRKGNIYAYNRNTPFIFIGGMPRSGTTLMRAMLDAHPDVRCGEETHVVPRIIDSRFAWTKNKRDQERLKNGGVTDEVLDAAVSAFLIEIIVKHAKPAPYLCNKDPFVLSHTAYVNKLFPNAKFIFMIRDGRGSVHSIVSRQVGISGFNLTDYRDCFVKWNKNVKKMLAECQEAGADACLPVYYEQLVLHPEENMRRILEFLDIEWNDRVLHHEEFIGNEIILSKTERSSDQVIKPVNLEALTSWVGEISDDVLNELDTLAPMLAYLGYNPKDKSPKYGEPDEKVKENTLKVKQNSDHWIQLARNMSFKHIGYNVYMNGKAVA